MEDFVKKLEQLRDLAKGLLSKPNHNNLVPAIKLPTTKPLSVTSAPAVAPTKIPGAGPASAKDPKAMAAQLKNPRPTKPKIEVMKTAVNGQWSLEKQDDEQHYRIHVDGNPVTKPMTLKDLVTTHGPVKHIESVPQNKVIPVKAVAPIKKTD
jgi:hypothetical protein